MNALVKEVRHNPMLWLLVFVPVVLVAHKAKPEAHTMLFVLSVLAIVPLAALLSHATESVAAKTGDTIGGLLNATLGNLTELVIAVAALRAGEYMLVKASIAGAIVTNTLFMLSMSFLLGGLKHHVQEYNRIGARLQASLLFLATIALLIPSAVSRAESAGAAAFTRKLSAGLAVLLLLTYALGMVFSLKTHREFFGSKEHHGEEGEAPWPIGLAVGTLAGVTIFVALVSEVFVESVQKAAESFGMTPAFVGFIVVSLVGGAAEMASAFGSARKDRLDMSVGIALGSASQIALFVAPVLVLLSYVIGPTPMDLQFWPGAVVMMLIATLAVSLVTNSGALRVVRRGIIDDGLPDLRADALSPAAAGAVPSSRTSYVVRRAAHGALRELERQRFGAWNLWAGDRRCCSTFCSCTAAPYALRANSIFGTNPNELRLQTERLSNEVASSSISLATAMTLLS